MIKLKDLLLEAVSQGELNQVEKYLDKIWGSVGIDVEFTRHFMDRVNDARNKKPISPAELIRIYRKIYKKYGKVLRWNGKELEMIAKTIMRKKDFKSSTKKYSVN